MNGRSDPQMLADIRPNEERAKAFVVSSHISMGVQAGPLMSEHEVGTHSKDVTVDCHHPRGTI